jgi:MoxR-like ATPase
MEAALAEPRGLDSARDAALRVIANVRRAVSGEAAIVERAVVALLAEGHVLVEDVPGVGKTTLARALARSLDCSFARIQLTPDVLPARPGVRERGARRRAQPRLAAHTVGAA